MNNPFSRRMMEQLQKKVTGKIDEEQLRSLAGRVKKQDLEDEDKLRQLIKSLSAISGTSLSPEKEDQILEMFRSKEVNPNDLQSLFKLLK